MDFASSLGAFDLLVTTNPDGSKSGASALSIDHIINIARNASQSGQNVGTAIRNAIAQKREEARADAPVGSTVSQGSFSGVSTKKVAAAPAETDFTAEQIAKKEELERNQRQEVREQKAREQRAIETLTVSEREGTQEELAAQYETGLGDPYSGEREDILGTQEQWSDYEAALQETQAILATQPSYATPSAPSPWDVVGFARGGMTSGKNLEIVGEEGPELVDLPPGTFVLPIKGLNQRQVRQAKRRGVPGYQAGGVVFEGLPFGLRQLQAGRAITPPRGYLSRAAGLTLPSAQAFQNITPESRDVFMDLASQAGIPPKSFAQELQLTQPRGARQPTVRMLPFSSRGAR